jgi:predicted DNA-binding ribbon-helix-helix protein
MCEYYVKADPIQYEQRSRTIRIRGVLTTIRLENSFWDILAEMAEQEGCTTNSLITMFHDEIIAERGEIPNFASFLRVTCVRYLRRTMIEQEKKLEAALGYSSVVNAASESTVSLPLTGTHDARPAGNVRAFSR